MYHWTAVLLVALTLVAGAEASQSSIELDDGSRIYGEVVSFDGGDYVIDSPALGRLRIDAGRIRTISSSGAGTGAHGVGGVDANQSAQLLGMQQQMMAAPEIMSMITALQEDPQLRAALADPQLMRAIAGGDLDAVRSNPSFRTLLSNPGIRAILERVR